MERLQVPPIRTPLAEANGSTANTAKEWYLYWRQAGERVNDHADSIAGLDTAVKGIASELAEVSRDIADTIAAGVHADRIATKPAPLDALWIETDRNNVIYQARAVAGLPAWVYVTGGMRGAIAARPADLGANDAGFVYFATDVHSLQFTWSGTAWAAVSEITTDGPRPMFTMLTAGGTQPARLSKLTSDNDVYLTQNLNFDGTNWLLDDVTKPGIMWILSGTNFLAYIAPAGPNPAAIREAWRANETQFVLNGKQILTVQQPAIAAPAGGTVIDAQARAAIGSLITTLRSMGITA